MRNLAVASIDERALSDEIGQLFCLVDNDVCFYDPNGFLRLERGICVSIQEALENVGRSEKLSIPIYLNFCSISNKVVLAFSTGDIVSVTISEGEVSHEGTIDVGLLAGKLSPGEDLIGLVDANFKLIVLDTEFDQVFETDLHGQGVEQPVTVGWGKKETQFRGSEGKLKDEIRPTAPSIDGAKDDGKVRISWRGDGEYLVVSIPVGNQRILKVVNKEGELVHSSEDVPGLESALSWRPNGSLIASSQQLPNKRVICFFEKNTLPHGLFELRGDWMVRELLWSCDSSVLAAVLEAQQTHIQLFTSNNYHWYTKYTVSFEEGEVLKYATWDTSETLLLHIFTYFDNKIRHKRYSWRWTVDCSSGASPDDLAFVSVIDGSSLLLTSFRRGIVPPPMSSYKIEAQKPINAVGFIQNGAEGHDLSSNDLFVEQIDGTLSIYQYNASINKHKLSSQLLLKDLNIFQLTWISSEKFVGCKALTNGKHQLCVVNIPTDGCEISVNYVDVMQPITMIRRKPDGNGVLLCSGTLNFSLFNSNNFEVQALTSVPKCKGKILAVEMRNAPLVLDSSCTLFAGPECIASGVTSVHMYEDMVLATTLKHKLLCLPLSSPTAQTERAIEPGARLVTIIPRTGKVVLQMPRGNLEVVQPRALAIQTLKRLLDELEFGEAFAYMRRDRINFNCLCDHNFDNFCAKIDHFLAAVKDPVALCTFIAELVPENVTRTTYGAFYLDMLPRKDTSDKVNRICKLIIVTIDNHSDSDRLFLVKLSCLVKIGDTGAALLHIKEKINAERNGEKFVVSGSQGLKHVMYLIDIEQLFKIALGTYDLDLVMYVASNSQKDPKEYVPFLTNLQNMEIYYQRFTVDKFLKRYEKALENLVKCHGKLAECLELVESQKLHQKALTLFQPLSDGYKAVCLKFGDELRKQKRHDEEGFILLQGEHTKLALFAFTRSGNWRQVLHCANILNYNTDELSDLISSLVKSLRNEKRHEDVAKILLDYCKDVAGAVEALSSAHLFEEAVRICRLNGRDDLVKTVINAVLSAAESLTMNIRLSTESFKKQAERLKVVRAQKIEEVEVDWDDLQSESSRGSSRGSRSTMTSRSAKNSRKLERKLLSLKEGGAFEDLALIASLHDIASQTVGFMSQVRCFNLFMMTVGEFEAATGLQSVFRSYLDVISRLSPHIWRPIGCSEELGQNATSNSLAASWANRTASAMPVPIQAIQPKLLFPPSISSSIQWEFGILQPKGE